MNVPEPLLDLSDDDEEIVEYIARLENTRTYERSDHFNTMTEKDFIRRFRLTKRTALHVLDKIENKLEFTTNRAHSVSLINQLLCALRYYATGNFLITSGDLIGVSEATACRIVHRVTTAIADMQHNYISMPNTRQQCNDVAMDFYRIARFPRVIGALDCTHVRIQSPGGDDAELYRNRKGYFSVNVQAIATSNLKLADVVPRWFGSVHDSNIWDNSARKLDFVPGLYGNNLLLGDSGYAQTSYVMTPLANVNSQAEALYQEAQIRTRNVVERAFGVWKRRFPVLSRGIQVNLRRVPGIIIATAVLHNIALAQGEPEPETDPEFPLLQEPPEIGHDRIDRGGPLRNAGQRARQEIIQNYFGRLG